MNVNIRRIATEAQGGPQKPYAASGDGAV